MKGGWSTACLMASAAIILSGCQTASGADVIEESRSDSSAPDSFRDRTELPLCRDVVLDQGESLGPEALECLERGYAENGAELAVASPTTEGDLIVSHFRITPNAASLQIFIDTTRDTDGGGNWQASACPLPQGVDSIAACLGP